MTVVPAAKMFKTISKPVAGLLLLDTKSNADTAFCWPRGSDHAVDRDMWCVARFPTTFPLQVCVGADKGPGREMMSVKLTNSKDCLQRVLK